MSQAQQPEALRLRLAAEGHIALCKKFGPEGFHFDADPQDVLAILARMQELEAELASERRHSGASNAAAVRTLAAMGYSWHGGEQWKPPVTQAQQERAPLTGAQIASACLSYRHDYGLLPKEERFALMATARRWEHALEKEHAHGIQEKHG